jgi:hypothetical protein
MDYSKIEITDLASYIYERLKENGIEAILEGVCKLRFCRFSNSF